MHSEYEEILEMIQDIIDDDEEEISKNIRQRLEKVITILKEDAEPSDIRERALYEIEELGNNTNIDPYMRSMMLQLAAKLEEVK